MGLHIGYKCKCQQNLLLPTTGGSREPPTGRSTPPTVRGYPPRMGAKGECRIAAEARAQPPVSWPAPTPANPNRVPTVPDPLRRPRGDGVKPLF